MTQLTHWKKMENPDYIGSYAFQPGEKKTLTIRAVTRETITGAEGKREECTIIHWLEKEKPLIMNKTNAKTITKAFGTPYIEQWPGGRLVLGVEKVRAFGEIVEAVRVKSEKPQQAEQETQTQEACTDCGEIIAGVGKFSAEAIARASAKQFGAPLCADCAGARKERAAGDGNDGGGADEAGEGVAVGGAGSEA